MSKCSENKNPLIRNGTSQGQRAISKLSPSSVEIIDKSTEEWMVWAAQFSDHIAFTAPNNATAGTMKPFFAANISVKLALAASYQPKIISEYIREQLLYIEKEETNLQEVYTNLYDIIFSYFSIVDSLLKSTRADNEFAAILSNHLKSKLIPLQDRAYTYYKTSLLDTPPYASLIVDNDKIDIHIFHEAVKGHKDLISTDLHTLAKIWYENSPDFSGYYNGIAADPEIFGGFSDSVPRIKYITQHNFFTSILDEIKGSASFISKLSQKYISKYLSTWPNHQPNYALFLTWLQLLESTNKHLNELTGRHLDFYYKDVLNLTPLAQSPDKAFLVLELNKITTKYALKENVLFIGPKDEKGNLTTYKSLRETVLNKANIKHLSALYYGDDKDNIDSQINKGRLYAAPIINSADGLGEKLDKDAISWHPFHIREYQNAELDSIKMPQAVVGFAIASHYLRLKEGKRTIKLEIFPVNKIKFNKFSFKTLITTEKGWLEIDDPILDLLKDSDDRVIKLTITASIPADKVPVTSYNKDVHLGSLSASEPVLKVLLEHKDSEEFIYNKLSSLQVSTINLTVNVGEISGSYNENGIKNLELHNDASPLNPSKPFHPWGAEPKTGNAFVIGSDEIFYKPGAKIQLNFDWKDYPLKSDGTINLSALDHDSQSNVKYISFNSTNKPSSGDDGCVPMVEILKLKKNKWESLANNKQVFRGSDDAESTIIQKVAVNVNLSSADDSKVFLSKDQEWKPYNASSSKGFIKIKLNNDFGHRDYYSALQSFFKVSNDNATAPAYPYQPTLQAFSVSYEASCSLSVNSNDKSIFLSRPLEFFQTGPFGDSEQHRYLQDDSPNLISKLVSISDGLFKSQGSLFIGLENLNPGDTQSILFQLQEGSEDPLLEKPENHLKWEYLSENDDWKPFDEDDIGDNTNGLIESGLVNIIIPKDASLEHTSFENNLIWIRCFVEQAPDALCRIIGVYPNAIEVQRLIPGGTDYSSMISSSGEIKKLYVPEAKIKKIQQPYTSFDGKARELSDDFYLRASERLRHKNRAVTIWDYERLVLEAFPEIYKVKCLNHTQISGSPSEGDLIYNEVAPGNVAIITIPNLANRNDIDPLKPYTKKSTLQKIEDYLAERASCQVNICTAQPDFEEVKVKCNIFLRKEFTDTIYYKSVIQNEIMNFLSPWAYRSDTDLNFGGSIHQSVLIDFIEELVYVDYLTDFELIHIKSSGESTKVNEALASTSRSILVSVPAIKHDLTVSLSSSDSNDDIEC